MSTPLKLAMAQMLVKPGQPARNLQRAGEMIARAGEQGCGLIVLPECLDLGWMHSSVREEAQPIPGPFSDRLVDAARKNAIHVCAGLTERCGERFYNSAVLLSPTGEILIKHRKINELPMAHHLYSPGDRLSVADTAFGRVGISICADNAGDSLVFAHAMARMGAQIIVSPSAWAVSPDHDQSTNPYGATWINPYQTIARLYEIPVIGVSNVGVIEGGEWNGWNCIGCSLAIGAGGAILKQAAYGASAEELIILKVEIPPLRQEWGTHFGEILRARGYAGP